MNYAAIKLPKHTAASHNEGIFALYIFWDQKPWAWWKKLCYKLYILNSSSIWLELDKSLSIKKILIQNAYTHGNESRLIYNINCLFCKIN